MKNERLYIISGSGNDSVGLVGKITSPIAKVNGNIVDLRQDVIHGLFTIYLVVDLKDSSIKNIDELKKIADEISENTTLELSVNRYTPVPRDPEKKNFLLVLLGYDKPGISAAITETLSKYKINIEFSQMIAREDIFLMELLTDISKSTIPLDNLEKVLHESMNKIKINTMFQVEDVFNKKKRVIILNLENSFFKRDVISEIIQQTDLNNKDLLSVYPKNDINTSINNSIKNLESLPIDVMNNIINNITVTSGTIELLQTLKIMGYKIVIISTAFTVFLDYLKKMLDIDYCFGFELPFNDDTKAIIKDTDIDFLSLINEKKIKSYLIKQEGIAEEDITVISDKNRKNEDSPAIRVNFNLKSILDYYNQHILSKENIIGLLGSFGIPKL